MVTRNNAFLTFYRWFRRNYTELHRQISVCWWEKYGLSIIWKSRQIWGESALWKSDHNMPLKHWYQFSSIIHVLISFFCSKSIDHLGTESVQYIVLTHRMFWKYDFSYNPDLSRKNGPCSVKIAWYRVSQKKVYSSFLGKRWNKCLLKLTSFTPCSAQTLLYHLTKFY